MRQMKFLKNIILKKNNGYSLIELIIAITIGTFILLAVLTGAFVLRKGFDRTKKESVRIDDIAKFANIIINDTLNPDLFPHHPFQGTEDNTDDFYVLESNHITFFANGGKVEYKLSDATSDGLIITRDEKENKFSFIKDFNIQYFDRKGFEIISVNSNDNPDSCLMNFTFYDNKKRSIKMKL